MEVWVDLSPQSQPCAPRTITSVNVPAIVTIIVAIVTVIVIAIVIIVIVIVIATAIAIVIVVNALVALLSKSSNA